MPARVSASSRVGSDGVREARLPGELQDSSLDAAGLELLYRSQSPRLLRVFRRRSSSPEEAQDLVQEVFVRLAGIGAGRLKALTHPEAYVARIARNLLVNQGESAAVRSRHLHVVAQEENIAVVDQQSRLEARDMLRRLEAAVLRLKPRTREVFLAHRVEGLSYAEIAERTGLKVKGVEKHMSKAIAAIDRHMDRP
jgi:RNA polymerase sigma factor (sigma-70 family)